MLPERLACDVCLLRPWRWADKPALLRHANNRNVSRNLRDVFPYPYTEADADAWLCRAATAPTPEGLYAIEVDGEAAGGIEVRRRGDVERHSAEVGYWLGELCWGRGIMTAALRAVTAAALAEPDLWRLEAPVFAWNARSMRVLENAGYRREAVLVRSGVKDGVVFDQVLYAITRDGGLPYAPAFTIAAARTAGDFEAARELVAEYAQSLGVSLAFQGFEEEIADLARAYAAPAGTLLLARREDAAVACVAVRALDGRACELKRLYVRPGARGSGLGRTLTMHAIAWARAAGYRAMRLDTLPSMTEARKLYAALGFHEIPSYRHNPVPGTAYLELVLARDG
jgi:RimJ/RimL family protein N-acetyltransferase